MANFDVRGGLEAIRDTSSDIASRRLADSMLHAMEANGRQVLWQGHYGNYDESNYTDLFTDPTECLKAMGWIDRDGRPIDVRGENIHWTLTAMPVYNSWEEQKADDEFPWFDYSWQAQFEYHYLPLLIRKYNNDERLDAHEQTVLGLR